MHHSRNQQPLRILLAEGDEHERIAFCRAFQKSDITAEITACVRAGEILAKVENCAVPWDIAVVDHILPDMSGLSLCKRLIEKKVPLPLILMTAQGSERLAAEALKSGVWDYIVKEPKAGCLDLLPLVLGKAVERYAQQRDLQKEIKRFKKREFELESAREAAEASNRAKSNFLSSMSHELRTPLNAIIGFSEMLIDRHFGDLNKKQARYATNIHDSGTHLLGLVNDILDLSKIDAGKMELALSRVNIAALLTESLVVVQEGCEKKGIELNTAISEALSNFQIQADEQKLRQILYNLLSNAAKFTPDGGKIRVAANLIPDSGPRIAELQKQGTIETAQSAIEISVADSGIGLAPEKLESVFDLFYQVRGAFSGKTKGTGLGLYLVRKMVGMHGGTVRAESKGRGKGSTFTFRIPVVQPDKMPLILVADDEVHIRHLLAQALTLDGKYRVETARNGTEAMLKLGKIRPDLIILDLFMPGMNGVEVCRAIRDDADLKQLPIILITGFPDKPELQEILTPQRNL